MNKTLVKKAAITSMALLTLAGGASSAFADGKGKGHDSESKSKQDWEDQRKWDDRDDDNDYNDDKDNKKKKEKGGIHLHFKDEKELKWALEHIIRLASKGVFTGYADGTFKPQQKITRIETIVAAVRLMGLKEQAESAEEMATKLNFKDAEQLKRKYPWATGYIAVALEKDLFAETDDVVQPDKSATRLFAATLLVKALGLEAEAKAKNNTELNFKDAKNIPAGSVGYVAVALEKGIITGYSDKTFRPNQPVTRAELAAILDRTDNEMPDHDAQAITGKLKAAPANGSLVVVKPDGTETTLAIDSNVFVFRNNVKSDLSSLLAGDEVFIRTYQNKVIFIEVKKPSVDYTIESGKFNSFTLNADGKITAVSISKPFNGGEQVLVLNVAPDMQVVGKVTKLNPGQAVELKLVNNVVTSIKVK
ncbi:S-layer homology domain-containing protein [Paenibacillus sp. GCM10027626]|uniref:S-layer homology domain-containing protein n=1 Tax=Paenibacillus sp. GCM10027626 TaxID=3273411 RepID=UPI00363DFE38